MNLVQYRSHFTVFISMSDLELAAEIRGSLSQLGYECYTFADPKVLKERLHEAKPHILVQHVEDMGLNVGRFLSGIREDAPELLIICVGDLRERSRLSKYHDFGINDHIPLGAGFEEAIGWSVDRAIESLIYVYQNEQLLEQLEQQSENTLVEPEEASTEDQSAFTRLANEFHVAEESPKAAKDESQTAFLSSIERANLAFGRCQDQEELVEALLIHLKNNLDNQGQYLYFRFISSAYSFVVTHFSGNFPSDTKGVGFKLKPEESVEFEQWMKAPRELESLRDLLKQAFGVSDFQVETIEAGGQLAGLLLRTEPLEFSLLEGPYWRVTLALFSQRLNLLLYQKQLQASEARDEVTQLFARHQLRPKLAAEVARSRRLKMPVALIHCRVDREAELRSRLDETSYEQCLKMIAGLIDRSSRVNDLVFRVGELHFTMVLPHSTAKGATVRAERLRRVIESTPFTASALHLTLSFGVAEYPSHALGVDDLIQLSLLAAEQVQQSGGNKVCLATAPPEFTPDFEVDANWETT